MLLAAVSLRSAAIALVVTAAACAKVDPGGEKSDGAPPPSANDDSRISGGDGSAGGGGGGTDVAQLADVAEVAAGPTVDGLNCGVSTFALERVPPDVLILLDRSGSMAAPALDPVTCSSRFCPSKWSDIKDALLATVTSSQAAINWGLKLFANSDTCGVTEDVAAPVAPRNADAITSAIQRAFPYGLTPTRLALESSHRYLMTLTRPNPRYLVLATDGIPGCDFGMDEAAAATMAVAKIAAAGIPVFVIGIATSVEPAADATLSAMARAGGKPRAAKPAYYPVTSADDLSAALATIGGQIVSCTLQIKSPPDPGNIAVDADGMRVPRNASDGWSYGPGMTSIELHGAWCTRYQSGAIKDVKAIFGCPGIIVP